MKRFASLGEILDVQADADPERAIYTFIDDRGASTTVGYASCRARAQAIAAALVERGARGQRALLLYRPGLDYTVALWACFYAGVTAVPAYPPDPTRLSRTLPRLRAIIKDVEPAVVLTESMIAAMTRMLPGGEALGASELLATDELSGGPSSVELAPVDPAALALIQYTSGSTGSPKGVMLSHRSLLANIGVYTRYLGDPGTTCVMWLPLYHDMGLIGGLLTCPHEQMHCAFMSPLSFLRRPLAWLDALSSTRATYTGAPNFAYDLAVHKTTPEQRRALDLSQLRIACVGAEPTRPATLRRFTAAFADAGFRREAFRPCYGLAESSLFVAGGAAKGPAQVLRVPRLMTASGEPITAKVATLADTDEPDESVRELIGHGPALEGHTRLIVDPETRRPLPELHVGEIWIAGPSLGSGYWGDESASADTYGARTAAGEGPFLRTGDLGFVHRGELYVSGRLKDLVIIRGRNLHPEDLEASVEFAHPRVRPGCCAAFSVDEGNDEQLVLVCELDTGIGDDALATVADEIWRAVSDAVTHGHGIAVDRLVLIPARRLNKTSSGKVQRGACRTAYQGGQLEILAERQRTSTVGPCRSASSSTESIEQWLLDWTARRVGRSPELIDRDQTLTALGIDSLGFATLTYDVEEQFGLVVTELHALPGVVLSIRGLAHSLAATLAHDHAPS